MNERLYFKSIEEHRGWYLVEYHPPFAENLFATLNLTLLEHPTSSAKGLLEAEVCRWLARYPVPIMAAAWDAAGDQILWTEQSPGFCVGWLTAEGQAVLSWDIADLTSHTCAWTPPEDWSAIYFDVPVRTDAEVKQAGQKSTAKTIAQWRLVRWLLVFWVGVIPASVALFEFLGPQWLGLLVLLIALAHAWKEVLKLFGKVKPTKREEAEQEKTRKMAHYFYHCELNPTGFARLKAENLAREEEKRTRDKAEKLLEQAGTRPTEVS